MGVPMDTITFTINNVSHTIKCADYPGYALAKYIREVARLQGTKVSCGEGGCGACIVTVEKFEGDAPRAVNSCLSPIQLCSGWKITTVEGLGDKKSGYHPIQLSLAAEGGTQCGYCSPGMVMQLHAFLQEHPDATMEQIDNILDGNICRCTGYRPILDAFKKFGSDAPPETKEKVAALVADIEDLNLNREGSICKRTGKECPGAGQCGGQGGGCHSSKGGEGHGNWFLPTNEKELLEILKSFTVDTKYRLVGGNTGTGVFKHDEEFYHAYVNINQVPELKEMSQEPMFLGANVSITDAIHFFKVAGEAVPMWTAISNHLSLIASVGIRNQGTLSGNLMMKHRHQDFPSDVFLALETVGAMLEIVRPDGAQDVVSLPDFLNQDMTRKYIRRITFSSGKDVSSKQSLNNLWAGSLQRSVNSKKTASKTSVGECFIRTFKIMPRHRNAHAYVNAGFRAMVDTQNGFMITEKPTIVFGAINEGFIHANATEEFLIGRSMSDHDIFLEALTILGTELVPENNPVLASPVYRKQLSMGLFYKFYLYVLGDSASDAVRSGATDLERGLTRGEQSWETDENQWPVSEPIEKLEARWQTAGEAQYVADIPEISGELNGAFVLSSMANAKVLSIDTSAALSLPGVVSFVTASDVPGVNSWKFNETPEEIFCSGISHYAGQSLGLIVAETREIAIAAARLVTIQYESIGPIVMDIEKGIENPDNVTPVAPAFVYGDVDNSMATSEKVVQGRFQMGAQYHFHMETQVAMAIPIEDGFEIAVASQDVTQIQAITALALGIPANSVNTTVRRLGGAYGAKITLPNHVATAAALAANKVQRPVRLWLPLEDNMKMFGKRNQYLFDYKIGLNASGNIQALETWIYADGGWSLSDVDSMFAIIFGQSCYKIPTCRMTPYGVRLDTPPPTSTRAPGMCNGHAMIEAIMQHASVELNMAPIDLRQANLVEQGDPIMPPPRTLEDPSPIVDMIEQAKISTEFVQRRDMVAQFNAANRWKKRGISMVPMRYDHWLQGFAMAGLSLKMNCLVSVFGLDGTISVAHNGIEMGQGINTKVAQVVAYSLGVPVSMIQCKPVTNLTNPNGSVTGGSCGSETNCVAALAACDILKERLAPAKKKLGPKATWLEIIWEANKNNVDLCARYMMEVEKDKFYGYQVWGVSVTEVEMDILTGETRIVRADVAEDAGLSTSPQVDIGQVEGAFAMGLGLWTSEEIKYHPTTGELLTCNTWEYKPPSAKDIPQDFRVSLTKNMRNPHGMLSSKATGEPALLMSVSVLFAIWDALNSSREDGGLSGWWALNGPATVEHIQQHAGVTPDQFIF